MTDSRASEKNCAGNYNPEIVSGEGGKATPFYAALSFRGKSFMLSLLASRIDM